MSTTYHTTGLRRAGATRGPKPSAPERIFGILPRGSKNGYLSRSQWTLLARLDREDLPEKQTARKTLLVLDDHGLVSRSGTFRAPTVTITERGRALWRLAKERTHEPERRAYTAHRR
jgi:DNA-binding MarR family transcriptional regulator